MIDQKIERVVMKNLAKIAVLSSLVLSVPVAAHADTMKLGIDASAQSGAPIRIDAVQADHPSGTYSLYTYPRTVTVSFTNLNATPARDIVFTLRGADGRIVSSFHDVGVFAQGVGINHNFDVVGVERRQELAVEQATFADGTMWHQGQPNPMIRRQAAANSR
jgi:hypothetical protein